MVRQNRKIQFIILLTLVCLVGTMTIAYAILSTTLNINGTAQVMDASWNVHFENIEVNPNSVPINPKITDNDKITFQANLTTPGQFYKFTVDIVNNGSIDAMIESIIKNPELTTEQKKYLRYEVEYVDGSSINETQVLKSGETKTISVLLSYRNDIPISDLPKTETNLNLEIRLVYVQSTSIGTEILGNEKLVKIVSGDLNTVGSEICIKEECFHLISNNGYSVTMLSKYNLYVGGTYDINTNIWTEYGEDATGRQDPTMLGWKKDLQLRNGVLAFSETNYWEITEGHLKSEYGTNYPAYVYDENNYIYEPIENYKKYLEDLGVTIYDARTITVKELKKLGCLVEEHSCTNTYSWIYSTTYWIAEAHYENTIWNTDREGDFAYMSYDHYKSAGVRPVIEVPLTEF